MSTPRIGSSISTMPASEPSARANSAFCWLPPESDRMLLSTSGVRMLMRSRQVSAISASRARVDQDAAQHPPHRADRDVLARSTRAGRCRRSGGRRRRARPARSTARVARPPLRGVEELAQHLGLALAGEPGEPDHLAAIGGELAPVRSAPAAGRARAARRRAASSRAAAAASASPSATLPIAATSDVAGERAAPAARRPPCRRA